MTTKNDPLGQELFEIPYAPMAAVQVAAVHYRGLKLREALGPFGKGESVPLVVLNLHDSKLELYRSMSDTKPVHTAKVRLTVVPEQGSLL